MPVIDNLVGLDFETYSDVDLLKHGLDRYVKGKHFRPLIASMKWRTEGIYCGQRFNFVEDPEAVQALNFKLKDKIVVAHNAGFEQAVLDRMGIGLPSNRFIDSAVLARAAGAAGKLEAAAPQLLGMDKLEMGYELIKLFSIPGPYQEQSENLAFDWRVIADNLQKWEDFQHYCDVDAELGLLLAELILPTIMANEMAYNAVTMDMNVVGWHVDMDLVHEMQRRYQVNVAQAEETFRRDCNELDLNLSSPVQLKAWCAVRGVRARSFDEKHVASMLKQVEKKLATVPMSESKYAEMWEVLQMLRTKQILGGSSLKKLQTIIDTVGSDGRLHDQYLHVGAGATYRTTGRGVQMQNLPRLSGGVGDVEDWAQDWDNGYMAANLRQVFTASDPGGQLIVGDFSSVESRGLAWQAGEMWKLEAYAKGIPVYEMQAGLIFGKPYTEVTKPERQVGKVGELSCGYGAGGEAVQAFAKNMGIELTEGEAVKLVRDWREANPKTVDYWARLDAALHKVLETGIPQQVLMPHGSVRIAAIPSPASLVKEAPMPVKTLAIKMFLDNGTLLLSRVIHGAHIVGRNIRYYKPSERKTGELWTDHFTDPKTKQVKKFSVYGGKLAGLLTQSLCREVFMSSLREVANYVSGWNNVELVGQFHDEIVLDWSPIGLTLPKAKAMLEQCMTSTILPGFPLAADIKSDYRYTK
jgi:DNA polymerase